MAVNEQRLERIKVLQRDGHEDGSGKRAVNLTRKKMLLQVHDELVFEVPVGEIDATATLVKKVMEAAPLPAVTLKVPLIAEAGYARNWAEAH